MHKTWDIFCKVVDNFGDAGVAWRLARCLVGIKDNRVRLWIDDMPTLVRLCPALSESNRFSEDFCVVEDVEVRQWTASLPDNTPADVVVEAFGCTLPEKFVVAMACRHPRSVWINLEYLSAEEWVESCHGLKSLHSSLLLLKYFFFPGFVCGTGGLLREPDIQYRQHQFDRQCWLKALGINLSCEYTFLISLFSYEQPHLSLLLEAWSQHSSPVCVFVPEGRVLNDLAGFFGHEGGKAGSVHTQGALTVVILPFSDQNMYDELLWACDLNFVRGEDSFVRAQWAAKPFVWHIYPQDEEVHFTKLDAFIALYAMDLPDFAATALKQFWYAWNGKGNLAESWAVFALALPVFRQHAQEWSHTLIRQEDLATRLNQFCSHIIQLESKIQAL